MGYAQKISSPNGGYYLARYQDETGKRGAAVKDEQTGKPVHYKLKRDAQKAANAAETAIAEGRVTAAAEAAKPAEAITFGAWAETWYAAQRLAESTMANYRSHLGLILSRFKDHLMTDDGFPPVDVEAWEQDLLAAGYAPDSVRTYRATLHTCLQDAVPQLLPANPATKKANRGKRGVAKANAASKKEKVITSVFGGLLIAERMAILSGRDDEFVLPLTLQHGGLRLGEGIGLEREYIPPAFARPGILRVEWQLSEVEGRLIKTIPKYGSRGDVVIAPFLERLLDAHCSATIPAKCPCHGFAYVFRGLGAPRGTPKSGVTIRDVAEAAGVSTGTVSNVITRPELVTVKSRATVEDAIRDLGWLPGSAPVEPAWHWRRSGFEEMLTMAASGRFPMRQRRRGLAGEGVPLAGEWPGARVTGRYATRRAEWCWAPVAVGLTPHGLRHSLRTWMEESRVHPVLAEAQMRHEQTGVDVYRHVTEGMREEYRGLSEEAWDDALDRRLEMADRSPVRSLDRLLQELSQGVKREVRTRSAQERPVIVLGAKRKQAT